MTSLEPLLIRDLGVRTLTTREPGGTPQGELIRTLFAQDSVENPWLPLTEAFLVGAARVQHVQVKIKPALEKGIWVLCDRFADSTRVYQGMVAGATLESLISLATDGLEPDLTFVVDCPVDLAMSRTQARQLGSPQSSLPRPPHGFPSLQREAAATDSIGRFDLDNQGGHEQRRQAYLTLARRFPQRIVVIDGSQPPQMVLEQTLGVIKSRFSSSFIP
jgi:dTMP kinase